MAHGFWWETVFSFVFTYQQLCWLNLQCLDLLVLFRSQCPLLPLPGVPHLPELGSGEDAVVLAGPQSALRHTRSRCYGELYDISGQIFNHNVFIYKQSQNSWASLTSPLCFGLVCFLSSFILRYVSPGIIFHHGFFIRFS